MRTMKDSGIEWIGQIPEEWNIYPTKRFFRHTKTLAGEQVDLYERLALTMNGVIKRSKDDSEGLQPERFDTYQVLRENELVFKLIDLANVKTSRVGLSPYTGIVSPAYIVLSNKSKDNRFFYYFFMSMYYNEIFNNLGDNGVRSSLNAQDLLDVPMVSIPVETQSRIADFLDEKCGEIDRYIEKQQKIIEKLKAYKQAVITEAVTKGLDPTVPMKDSGIEWIGEIPEHWCIHKLCWDYSSMLGKMLDAKRANGDNMHPYIKNADVQWDEINTDNLDEMNFEETELERYSIRPGDLMICEGGEIGKCAIIPDDFPQGVFYQKALHRVRQRISTKGCIRFLFYLMFCMAKNNCFGTSPEKATIAHLPGDALNQLRLPYPPTDEQRGITLHLDNKCAEIDETISKTQMTIDKLAEYKKSLIYEAVTGKIEV